MDFCIYFPHVFYFDPPPPPSAKSHGVLSIFHVDNIESHKKRWQRHFSPLRSNAIKWKVYFAGHLELHSELGTSCGGTGIDHSLLDLTRGDTPERSSDLLFNNYRYRYKKFRLQCG